MIGVSFGPSLASSYAPSPPLVLRHSNSHSTAFKASLVFLPPFLLVLVVALTRPRFAVELEAVRLSRGFGLPSPSEGVDASVGVDVAGVDDTSESDPATTMAREFDVFLILCSAFHLLGAVALPLSMQAISVLDRVQEPWEGYVPSASNFLLSALCVTVSRACTIYVAPKVKGTHAFGRKPALLAACVVLATRCALLALFCKILEGRGGAPARYLILR